MAIGYEASVQTRCVMYDAWSENHVETNDFWIDISKVFKVIMRKKENCLGSTIFSNYTKINWQLRWR
jgi:hypothetical protein